jgi:hypothetical protein
VRTRFKTLTVGLVLVTAGVAGCSSPTSSSSAAVQDDATASAAMQAAAPSCADGGVCTFGDVGPGSGVVFCVASTPFSAWGTACGSNCLNLETPRYDVGGPIARCVGPVVAAGCSVDALGTAMRGGHLNTQAMLGTTNTPTDVI